MRSYSADDTVPPPPRPVLLLLLCRRLASRAPVLLASGCRPTNRRLIYRFAAAPYVAGCRLTLPSRIRSIDAPISAPPGVSLALGGHHSALARLRSLRSLLVWRVRPVRSSGSPATMMTTTTAATTKDAGGSSQRHVVRVSSSALLRADSARRYCVLVCNAGYLHSCANRMLIRANEATDQQASMQISVREGRFKRPDAGC